MTGQAERHSMISLVDEAVCNGARRWRACQEAGISVRTNQRWHRGGQINADQRPLAVRARPANKLSDSECEHIVTISNLAPFASVPPSQIVPRLADTGVYIASESSFYRVLHRAGQINHRGRSRARRKSGPPATHMARAIQQLWCWDVTYLPSRVKGQFHYLYLIEDLFSRKIVGAEVHACESGELAAELMQRTVLNERCTAKPLVLHADNGAPMKSQTLRVKLTELGITPSHNRPRVSNDNAFAESLFRTLKYCPQWPSSGFMTLEQARKWVSRFTGWYNEEHRHSAIRFVTPGQRHRGEDVQLLTQRDALYKTARAKNPNRWSRGTRNWTPVGTVTLNPVREDEKSELQLS